MEARMDLHDDDSISTRLHCGVIYAAATATCLIEGSLPVGEKWSSPRPRGGSRRAPRSVSRTPRRVLGDSGIYGFSWSRIQVPDVLLMEHKIESECQEEFRIFAIRDSRLKGRNHGPRNYQAVSAFYGRLLD